MFKYKKDVIKGLIPPKGIKRSNNIEGLELFPGDSEGEAGESGYEDEDENFLFDIHPKEKITIEISKEIQMGIANDNFSRDFKRF